MNRFCFGIVPAFFQHKCAEELVGGSQRVQRTGHELPFKFWLLSQNLSQLTIGLVPKIFARQVRRKKYANAVMNSVSGAAYSALYIRGQDALCITLGDRPS